MLSCRGAAEMCEKKTPKETRVKIMWTSGCCEAKQDTENRSHNWISDSYGTILINPSPPNTHTHTHLHTPSVARLVINPFKCFQWSVFVWSEPANQPQRPQWHKLWLHLIDQMKHFILVAIRRTDYFFPFAGCITACFSSCTCLDFFMVRQNNLCSLAFGAHALQLLTHW